MLAKKNWEYPRKNGSKHFQFLTTFSETNQCLLMKINFGASYKNHTLQEIEREKEDDRSLLCRIVRWQIVSPIARWARPIIRAAGAAAQQQYKQGTRRREVRTSGPLCITCEPPYGDLALPLVLVFLLPALLHPVPFSESLVLLPRTLCVFQLERK